ncbi:MAG: 3-deoxy-D-manno-octulosonic acid transferase [Holosporaceae bacterium]|jgi:3-deoxy-D-manno-octulosonic-acid transferase|nr:3-deoxy-D-manno-octulosonic acid transferase [Holosporaceae bacterium]
MLSIYKILVFMMSPFLKIYFYIRCLYGKDKIEGVKNHFGVATIKRPIGTLIWIHAASIGESMSALTYINHVKKQFPELHILLTTVTVTSANILSTKITKIPGCYHQFVVADNPIWIEKFLNHWSPGAVFFLESEIWPNIVDSIYGRKIPLFLLNARLSTKSFDRWKLFKKNFQTILEKFTCILAQSEIDEEKFRFFSPKNIKRIDNLKYANDPLPCDNNLLKVFQKICGNKKVFVAASTHEKEEETILEAHKKLKAKFDLVTFIIPRHLTRVGKICEIFTNYDVKFSLRSENNFSLDAEIFCVDTFGEVGTFFRLADVCFVGGSLVPIGGHNIYEPVMLGRPVLHGPFMDNALEVTEMLKQKQIAFEVKNADEIYKVCCELLLNPEKLKKICELAVDMTQNRSLEQIDSIVSLQKILNR